MTELCWMQQSFFTHLVSQHWTICSCKAALVVCRSQTVLQYSSLDATPDHHTLKLGSHSNSISFHEFIPSNQQANLRCVSSTEAHYNLVVSYCKNHKQLGSGCLVSRLQEGVLNRYILINIAGPQDNACEVPTQTGPHVVTSRLEYRTYPCHG